MWKNINNTHLSWTVCLKSKTAWKKEKEKKKHRDRHREREREKDEMIQTLVLCFSISILFFSTFECFCSLRKRRYGHNETKMKSIKTTGNFWSFGESSNHNHINIKIIIIINIIIIIEYFLDHHYHHHHHCSWLFATKWNPQNSISDNLAFLLSHKFFIKFFCFVSYLSLEEKILQF